MVFWGDGGVGGGSSTSMQCWHKLNITVLVSFAPSPKFFVHPFILVILIVLDVF